MKHCVIFDIDGTLLNTEVIYMRAWKEGGAELGFDVPDEALKKTRAVNSAQAMATFRAYCGEDFPYEIVRDRRVEIAERLIGETQGKDLQMIGAVQVLSWLKDRGICVAAASSTGKEKTLSHLEHAELLGFFDVIVGGDMVTKGKPNPDIFLKAAELAGICPENCIVVGDTPADVLAASAANIPVVLIPDQVPANEQTTALSMAVLSGLGQLQALIQKHFAL